jgi:Spy/CpxP family protein refolding chaperone
MAPITWALLALFCLALAVGSAAAQASNSTMSQDNSAQPRQATDRMEHISNQLNLTSDQKDKLRPVLDQEQKEMMDLHHDPNLTEDQKRAKEREIHQKYKSQIEGVLTPEQRTKYRQEREKATNKRHAAKSPSSTTGPSSTTPPQ